MTQTEEKKLVRALEKIAENTGKIAKNLEADIVINRFYENPADSTERLLPEPCEVTAEEALAAAKTIRNYCEHREDSCNNCGIRSWCGGERTYPPDAWDFEDDDND